MFEFVKGPIVKSPCAEGKPAEIKSACDIVNTLPTTYPAPINCTAKDETFVPFDPIFTVPPFPTC
jgi:hypothetical protein